MGRFKSTRRFVRASATGAEAGAYLWLWLPTTCLPAGTAHAWAKMGDACVHAGHAPQGLIDPTDSRCVGYFAVYVVSHPSNSWTDCWAGASRSSWTPAVSRRTLHVDRAAAVGRAIGVALAALGPTVTNDRQVARQP